MCSACSGPLAQARQSGQRPTVSKSASCTSWATSPATYTSPSGHCSAHHLRCGDGVLERGDRLRRWRGRGPARSASTRARASKSRASSTCPIVPARARRRPGARPCGGAGSGARALQSEHGRAAAGGGRAARARRPRRAGGRRRPAAPRGRGWPGTGPMDPGGSPEPALVSQVCRETDLPVFVLLRLNDSWTTTGGELTRLVGLAEDYLACGAAGRVVRVPRRRPRGRHRASAPTSPSGCASVPWTFHRAVDDTLDPRRSWRRLLGLPGLVAVRSAGSPRGIGQGYDDLLATAESDPAIAAAADARRRAARRARAVAGARRRSRVPPRAAGAAGRLAARPTSTPGYVRSWRLLLDARDGRASDGSGPGRRMTILIDPPDGPPAHGRLWSHLASDASYDELHAFARDARHPRARLRPRPLRRARRSGTTQVVAAGAAPGHLPRAGARGWSRAGLRRRKGARRADAL